MKRFDGEALCSGVVFEIERVEKFKIRTLATRTLSAGLLRSHEQSRSYSTCNMKADRQPTASARRPVKHGLQVKAKMLCPSNWATRNFVLRDSMRPKSRSGTFSDYAHRERKVQHDKFYITSRVESYEAIKRELH